MNAIIAIVTTIAIFGFILLMLRTTGEGGWDFPNREPAKIDRWWRPETWKEGQEFYQWAFVAPGFYRQLRPRLYCSTNEALEVASRATIHNRTLRTAVVHRVVYSKGHFWVKERVACTYRGRLIDSAATDRHLTKIGVEYTPSFTSVREAAEAHGYTYPDKKEKSIGELSNDY